MHVVHSPPNSPNWADTQHWAEFPMLYSKSLLFTYFVFLKHISLAARDLSSSTWNLHFVTWDPWLFCIGSLVVACEFSCFVECGIFPDHGLNWCPSTERQMLNHWTSLRKETSFPWQPALDTNTTTAVSWQHLGKAEGKKKTLCLREKQLRQLLRRFHFLID